MDPVDALNSVFPSSSAFIEGADSARDYAQSCVDHLQQQLENRPDISELRSWAQQAPQDLATLTSEVREIQKTGNATLESVKSVTGGIKRLDTAKENLTATIRMLRQLKMLTNLYIQLDSLLKERRYEDMTGSVRAASDLIDYFRPFRPLPKISQISQEIGEMETKIYNQVEDDFRSALEAQSDPSSNSAAALKAACTVLDSLDSASGKATARQRLVHFYCDKMLEDYSRIFLPNDEAGSLENVKRRFTYLKNKVLLVYLSSHHKCFPETWNVRQDLVRTACTRTSNDLVGQLQQLRGTNNDQIQLLLATLQDCDDFERFAKCPGEITSHITPFLSLWVEFQDRQLAQRIISYSKILAAPEDTDGVIPSSKELVNYYRALLAQLAKLRHQRDTLMELATVMADRLGHYATKVLLAYLPSYIRSPEEIHLVGVVGMTAEYIISTTHQLERNIVTQLEAASTAPSSTMSASTASLASPATQHGSRAQISSETDGTDSVDSAADNDTTAGRIESVFEDSLSRYRHVSIRVEDLFVFYAQRSIEPVWHELANRFAAVHRGGQSADVSRVSPFMFDIIEHINTLLTSFFTAAPQAGLIFNVGTKIAEAVCVGYLTVAMARIPKPIGESQAEQLLLDFGAIKSQSLLKIASLAPEEATEGRGAARLERLTPKIMEIANLAEAVLKLLMTPSEPMDTFVMNYQLLIKDRSTLNFRKILEVKGIRFQNEAIGKFKLMASQEPHLVAENLMLKQIPTVPPPTPSGLSSAFENASFSLTSSPSQPGRHGHTNSVGGFNMGQFRKLGGLLRRENP